MNCTKTRRSHSLEKKPVSPHKTSIIRFAKYMSQRSFSNQKLKDVLKQKIKKQQRETKIDLTNYRPVKLNFQTTNPQTIAPNNVLRNRILRNIRLTSIKQQNN